MTEGARPAACGNRSGAFRPLLSRVFRLQVLGVSSLAGVVYLSAELDEAPPRDNKRQ
jgi:hypothetical protein